MSLAHDLTTRFLEVVQVLDVVLIILEIMEMPW